MRGFFIKKIVILFCVVFGILAFEIGSFSWLAFFLGGGCIVAV